jgi:hypothetical protein
MQGQGLKKAPSARTLARLMGMGRNHLTKADTLTVAAIEAGVPSLADARSLVERFQTMIRTKAATELAGWIDQARVSLIAPLARGVAKDLAAIRAAITEPWSNGQTEGQVTRLVLLQTLAGDERGTEKRDNSGSDPEELANEGGLCRHVAATNVVNLPFPHHRHHLVAGQRPSCRS